MPSPSARLLATLSFSIVCLLSTAQPPTAEPPLRLLSLRPADTLHQGRFWSLLGAGAAGYTATMVGLNRAWYADYPRSGFHTFNDLREWNQMDKMGHWLMSYNIARWTGTGARWTGMNPRAAAWAGFAGGQLVQTSFEIFDGFSKQWGWSWSDVAFNSLGSGMFLAQELGWREQRIVMKMSAWPVRYPEEPIFAVNPGFENVSTTLRARADALYGTTPIDFFLKNYNTLVVWASVNPRSFMPADRAIWLPRWLNVAVGMGADNLFAGFDYAWAAEKDCQNCPHFRVDPEKYPRTRQFFLSLDVDFTRLRVKNRLLRTLLSTANILKFPAPTLELRSGGRLRFHPFYF